MIGRLFTIRTIKQRLRFWVGLILLLTGILTFIPILLFQKNQHQDEERIRMDQIATHQQLFINNWLKERVHDIDTLANAPSTKLLQLDNMDTLFHSFVHRQDEFSAIVYLDSEGKTIIDTKVKGRVQSTHNLSDRAYFKEGLKGNSYISDVLSSLNSGQPIVIISSPVFNEQQQFQGVVFGAVYLDSIDRAIKNLTLGESGESYLVDLNGVMITEGHHSPQGVQAKESAENTIKQRKITTYIMDQALKNQPVEHSYTDYQGEEVIGSYKWVNHGQWLIISEIDKSEVDRPFYRSLLFMGITLFAVMVTGFLMVVRVSNVMEKPIRQLVTGTQTIRSGKYNYRIESVDLRSGSVELQELCEAFNQMSATIDSNIQLLEESEERYRKLIELSPDAILILAKDSITFVNESGRIMLGATTSEEIVGRSMQSIVHPDSLPLFIQQTEALFVNQESFLPTERKYIRLDGRVITVEASSALFTLKGEDAAFVIVRDITERKMFEEKLYQANEQFKRLSIIDGLTQVANRRMFDDTLAKEWCKAVNDGKQLSLILFDIDCFKMYNDTYGHLGGDLCLKEIATAVQAMFTKPGQLFARYGGEEFVVILSDTSTEEAVEVGEAIRSQIHALRIQHVSSTVRNVVTVSVGVASGIPRLEQDMKAIIVAADKALYAAKLAGRDQLKLAESPW